MFIIVAIFIIGLFFGSFLNVVIDRIPRNETVIKGRSYCEACKHELSWYDLLPLLSFVFLRGKCRYCRAKLSYYYPVIELTTAILFVATYLLTTNGLQLAIEGNFQSLAANPQLLINLFYYIYMVSSFIIIFFTDLRYGIIPDRIVFSSIAVNLVYLQFFNPQALTVNLLTGVGALLFFLFISFLFYVLTKKIGFGGGDIKFSFLLGLFLGFPDAIIAVYIAFLTGALISIILIIWRKKRFFRDSLPFGPFLVWGLLISLYWGDIILSKVGNLLGF